MRISVCLLLASLAWSAPTRLPLVFEANRGQAPAAVQFTCRTPAGALSLLPGGEAILSDPGAPPVRLRLLGAAQPVGAGASPLEGRSHYLLGADRARWVRGVPQYARVEYHAVYPGIDLAWYGNEYLESDFLLAPGADPARIRWRIEGARRLALDPSGDLLIDGLRLKAPVLYQPGAVRRPVEGSYRLEGDTVSFRVGAYDRTRPLVIDPVLVFSASLGTDATTHPAAVTGDRDGNVYLAGTTKANNLSSGSAAQKQPGGLTDAFVAKLDSSGKLLFLTYLGGSANESVYEIALDSAGLVVAGSTESANFPSTAAALQPRAGGGLDGFIARLSPAGDSLAFSTFLGGSGADWVHRVAIDPSGNIVAAGHTGSDNFPVTAQAAQRTPGGRGDAFVTRLNPSGAALLFSTFLGGSMFDAAYGLAVDTLGLIYVAGQTSSANFTTTPDAPQTVFGGSGDAFLTILLSSGSIAFSTYWGGYLSDAAMAVAVDREGGIFVTGWTESKTFPAALLAQTIKPTPAIQGFLAKLSFPLAGSSTSTRTASLTGGAAIDTTHYGVTAVMSYSIFMPGRGDTLLGNVQVVPNPWGAGHILAAAIKAYDSSGLSSGLQPFGTVWFDAQTGKPLQTTTGNYAGGAIGIGPNGETYVAGYTGKGFGVSKLQGVQPLQTYNSSGWVGDPVSTATGEFYDTVEDLDLGGTPALRLERHYSSLLGANGLEGALGTNWMHNFEARLRWARSRASVTLFGGVTIAFDRSGGAYVPASDARHRYHYQLVASGSRYQFLDLPANLVYTFSSSGALERIEDRNGNALTVTQSAAGPTQVADGLGRTLTFTYSGGRLASVQDQAGRSVLFEYSGDNLASATAADGKTTRYTYTAAGGVTGLLTGITLPAGNQPLSLTYDSAGRVATQADSRGNTSRLAYHTPSPYLTEVEEPLDTRYQHRHSVTGQLTATVDPAGKQAAYEYDGAGRRATSIDRLGRRTTVATHAPSGLPASYTDAEEAVTRYTWEAQAQGGFAFYNLKQIQYPDGTSWSYTYDGAGNVLTAAREGDTWRYTYDQRGRPLTVTGSSGTATYTYQDDGMPASIRSPAGETTRMEYDNLKRLVKVIHPDDSTDEYQYDGGDRLVSHKEARGGTARFAYNGNGRISAETGAAGGAVRTGYDTDDQPVTVTDALEKTTTATRDARGRVVRVANPAGDALAFDYDALDRLTAVSDAAGALARYTYDAEGVPLTFTDGASRTWSFAADKLGRPIAITAPSGAATRLSYDSMGRLTAAADPLDRVTRYTYDRQGWLTGASLPGGVTASYQTGNNRSLRLTDPNGGVWERLRDSDGRLSQLRDPLGRTTNYTYDGTARAATVESPEGAVVHTYDAAENLVRRQAGETVEEFYYDWAGWLVAGPEIELAYDANGSLAASNGLTIARDDAGRIRSVTYAPGKTVIYQYDARGLLASITDWTGGVTRFAYNGARQMTSIERPNGVTTTFTYDRDGRVQSIEERKDEVLASLALTRDGLGRVVSAERNLPLELDLAAADESREFDASHQSTGAAYDGLGRLVSDASAAYQWDAFSRLAGVSAGDAGAAFGYDGRGMLIRNNGRVYVQNYALDLPSVAVERQDGADLRYYVHLPDGSLLYSLDAATDARRFYHFDEAGSATILTGDDGAVTDAYAVSPYGEVLSRRGESDNPYTFQGQWGVLQASGGLYYMRARWYHAGSARFLSPEPLRLADPRQLNPYQYALGDPLLHADPSGLAPDATSASSANPLAMLFLQTWARSIPWANSVRLPNRLVNFLGECMMAEVWSGAFQPFWEMENAIAEWALDESIQRAAGFGTKPPNWVVHTVSRPGVTFFPGRVFFPGRMDNASSGDQPAGVPQSPPPGSEPVSLWVYNPFEQALPGSPYTSGDPGFLPGNNWTAGPIVKPETRAKRKRSRATRRRWRRARWVSSYQAGPY